LKGRQPRNGCARTSGATNRRQSSNEIQERDVERVVAVEVAPASAKTAGRNSHGSIFTSSRLCPNDSPERWQARRQRRRRLRSGSPRSAKRGAPDAWDRDEAELCTTANKQPRASKRGGEGKLLAAKTPRVCGASSTSACTGQVPRRRTSSSPACLLLSRPRRNLAAPSATLGAAALDQFLEPIQIAAHSTLVEAGG